MADILLKPGQALIKKNIDDPLDAVRAKIAAQFSPKPGPGPDTTFDTPIRTDGNEVGPSQLPPDQEEARMQGMLAAAENMKRLKEKEAAMRMKLDAEDAAFKQREAEFDPSQYKEYKRPGQQEEAITPPARFGGLKARMQGERGAVTQPEPQPQGMIELSDDPEEAQRQIEAAHRGR